MGSVRFACWYSSYLQPRRSRLQSKPLLRSYSLRDQHVDEYIQDCYYSSQKLKQQLETKEAYGATGHSEIQDDLSCAIEIPWVVCLLALLELWFRQYLESAHFVKHSEESSGEYISHKQRVFHFSQKSLSVSLRDAKWNMVVSCEKPLRLLFFSNRWFGFLFSFLVELEFKWTEPNQANVKR